jgi:hypothetical protein
MLVPFTKEYRNMIEARSEMPYEPKYKKSDIFLSSTLMYLQSTLRLIDSTEEEINEKRKEIYEMSKLFMGKVFNRMDMKGKGYITPKEIGMFMKENGAIIMSNDSDLLFIRLDKDRDGKVTLGDLIKEIVPVITAQ